MTRLLHAPLVAVLLSGCATTSAPRLPGPLPDWPLAGCQQLAAGLPSHSLLARCGGVELEAREGELPEELGAGREGAWREGRAEVLSRDLGYTRRERLSLPLPGGAVEVLRVTGRPPEFGSTRMDYLAERPLEGRRLRVASCTLFEDSPEGRAQCERQLVTLLQYGPSLDPPSELLLAQFHALVGEPVVLPGDCTSLPPVNGGRKTSPGGAVFCTGRLAVSWESSPEGRSPAKEYERMARRGLKKPREGQKMEALTCHLRGRPTPCVRGTGAQDLGIASGVFFLGVSREEPALLISCTASDSVPRLRGLCERLFAPQPPAPAAKGEE